MFVYQGKINDTDAIICVSETVDEGKQIPLTNGQAFAVYEAEPGKLTAAAGTFADGEFTPED